MAIVDRKGRVNSFAARMALFVCTLLISLTAFELFLRAGFCQPSFDMNGWQIVLDRKILFKIKPNSGADINHLGFRGPDISEHSQKPRVLFLGDSFVFGVNVIYRKTAPAVLQKLLSDKEEVINMGVQGYGPDQSLIQLTDQGLQLNPSLVILSIFPANDFNDVSKNQLFVVSDGALHPYHPNVVEATLPRLELVYLSEFVATKLKRERKVGLSRPFYLVANGNAYDQLFITLFADGYDLDLIHDVHSPFSKQKIELMSAILKRFKDMLDQRKIHFLVIILPSAASMQEDNFFKASNVPIEKYFINEEVIRKICERQAIRYINFYSLFQGEKQKDPSMLFYDRRDGHLTENGYKYVAQTIYNYIQAPHF